MEWSKLTAQQKADYVQGLFIALRDTTLERRTVMTLMKRIGLADGQQVLSDARSFVELETRGWIVDQRDVDYIWRRCRERNVAQELIDIIDSQPSI